VGIRFSETREIPVEQLEALFLLALWESGKYPEKLGRAIRNSDAVVSAWDENKLVGLGNSITDGEFLVYIPWLLVAPEHRRRGIGTGIMNRLMKIFPHIPRIVLEVNREQQGFYERLGFAENNEVVSMTLKNE